MPPSSPAGRVVALLLILAALGAAVWALRPGGDPGTPPRPEAPATADPSGPAAPATGSAPAEQGERRAERTAAQADVPSAAAAKAPAPAEPPRQVVATVRGRVVDPTSAPIAGAKVAVVEKGEVPAGIGLPRELTERRGTAATTDRQGRFELPLHAPGPFELAATHEDRPEVRASGSTERAQAEDVLIVMRDGGTIAGQIVDAPTDPGPIKVIARRVETGTAAVARAVDGALLDLGDLVEGMDLPIGAREAAVAADGAFVVRGLDPDASYTVHGLRAPPDAMPSRCTERVNVRSGASGVPLRWRPTFAIVARVVDAATGRAIEDLDVAVGPVHRMKVLGMSVPVPMRQPLPQRRFANGNVTIDGIAVAEGDGKQLSVQFRAPGRRPWTRDDIDPPTRGNVDLGTVQLAEAPVVRVTVTDARGPVAGARVRVAAPVDQDGEPRREVSFSTTMSAPGVANDAPTDERSDVAVTDAAGIALVTTDPGRTSLVVESAAHSRWQSPAFEVPTTGTVDHAAFLVRGATVRTTVRDGHGKLLARTEVHRRAEKGEDQENVTTDPNGVAIFARVAPGAHVFSVPASRPSSPVRMGLSLGASGLRAGEVRVEATDGADMEIELATPLRGSLRGVVTLDGTPLGRADVRVDDVPADDTAAQHAELGAAVESVVAAFGGASGPRTKTDSDGGFELHDVPAGRRRLVVLHKDLAMSAFVDLTLEEGENVRDVALRGTTIRGRVLQGDGAPLQGAAVSVDVDGRAADAAAELADAAEVVGDLFGSTQRREVRTDADGRFELRGVRAGRDLRVEASARMHTNATAKVAALLEGTAHEGVELRLGPAGRIRVKSSQPMAAVVAEWAGAGALPEGSRARRTTILRGGRGTIEGAAPGSWRLHIDGPADGAGASERTVTVAAGSTVDVDL
ncbi:MAG: carboxypeptidase regulatory-like domain-containing protein [Planctomycetes bacterium]|nr:carboxypeptidase regulatory-like domain-containing protein [Planctomycetota bacterium]